MSQETYSNAVAQVAALRFSMKPPSAHSADVAFDEAAQASVNSTADFNPMTSNLSANSPMADWSRAVAQMVEDAGPSIAAVRVGRRESACAVLWRAGHLVTVAHPLRRTHGIPLRLPDGEEVEGELAGHDGGTDIAVLRLPDDAAASMTPLLVGDDASVRAGHWVAAIARTIDGDLIVSAGLIGRASGPWRTWRGGELDRLIRLDGGLYAGFAGAAVLDANGRAVGIATPALSRSAGVVLPASTVQRVAQELLTRGRIARGYLGIGTQSADVAASIAEAHQLTERTGLLVTAVADGSPAAEAGFLLGDVLIEFAGRRIRDIDELQASLGGERIGQRVPAFVLRAGERRDLTVTLGERPRAHCC